MFEEAGAESARKLSACQGLTLQKRHENALFLQLCRRSSPKKSEREPRKPQNEPVEPYMASENAEKLIPEPRNEHKVCRPSGEKRAKALFLQHFKK